MTEEEAKTKKCPLLFMMHVSSFNALPRGPAVEYGCIGSACMMWRKEYRLEQGEHSPEMVDDGGHCGLAGKP